MAGATAINIFGNTVQFGTVAGVAFTSNANLSISASATLDSLTITAVGALNVNAHIFQAAYYAVLGGYNLNNAVSLPAGMGIGTVGVGIAWNQALTGETDFINLQGGGVGVLGGFRFYGNKNTATPTVLATLDNTGKFSATVVANAVWNDIADYFEVEKDTPIEYGCAYVYADGHHRLSRVYAEMGVLGIASDTLGFGVGEKSKEIPQIPIAIGGIVLAHVDKVYPSGTPLTCTEDGVLTEMGITAKMEYPERLLATFYKQESKDIWNGVMVNGRCWVKVK